MKTTLKHFSILLALFSYTFSNLSAQVGRLPLSPTQKLEQNIGLTDITIEYSRPSKRDRVIFGALVPYGKYWRTGANRNTTINFNQEVFINKQKVSKGKYAIFSLPNPNSWEIILYDDTDNWDVPEIIDTSKIVARTTVVPRQLRQVQEVLSITIGDFTNYTFDLNIAWDKTTVTIPIELNTKALMDKKIKDHLEGPTYGDYYLSAVYQMESGKEFDKGLQWINKAMEVKREGDWWDFRVKAILLMELGQYAEAKKVAKEGLIKGKEEEREYAINEFNRILAELENE